MNAGNLKLNYCWNTEARQFKFTKAQRVAELKQMKSTKMNQFISALENEHSLGVSIPGNKTFR